MNYSKLKEMYPFFYKLYLYNKIFSSDPGLDYEDVTDVIEINDKIRNMYLINGDLDYTLFCLLTCCGQMLGRQYFKDGNSRTLKQFIRNYLSDLGYELEFDFSDNVMPLLLDNEQATIKDIERFKEITNIKKCESRKL